MNIIDDIIIPQFNELQLGQIKTLTPIEQGISQHCFHVVVSSPKLNVNDSSDNALNKPSNELVNDTNYIIKVYLHIKELTSLREFKTYKALNNQWPYSAKLIGHSSNILVLEKLAGHTLASSQQCNKVFKSDNTQKLNITFQMMAELHQTSVKQFSFCQSVNFTKVFSQLLQPATPCSLNTYFSTALFTAIKKNINALLEIQKELVLMTNKDDLVICHGDFNFGNIIVNNRLDNNADKPISVIDFESLCLMPAEYDIAMCLAVNEISSIYITEAIACYQKHTKRPNKLNKALIENYYKISLYINGLWYLQQSLNTKQLSSKKIKTHQNNAISQFKLLQYSLICPQEKALFTNAFS